MTRMDVRAWSVSVSVRVWSFFMTRMNVTKGVFYDQDGCESVEALHPRKRPPGGGQCSSVGYELGLYIGCIGGVRDVRLRSLSVNLSSRSL